MSGPIPLELVTSGRDLTEPRLSPSGDAVAFVQKWRSRTAIVTMALADDARERLFTIGPEPAAGRGLGGGCFDWVVQSGAEGVVYAAGDGELWVQLGDEVRRFTSHEREVRAPVVSRSLVVYVVDEAEVWSRDLETGASNRLDDGRHEFCFDPAISPEGTTVSWAGWSPPAMPWDAGERVDVDLATGVLTSWRPDDGAVQQPRFAPDGSPVCVHDRSGWLNVYIGSQPVLAEELEHAGPTWGMGTRSFAVSPDGTRVVVARNEGGFGSLCVVELAAGAVREVGRGVHGHLSWVGGRLVTLRTGARTPTEIVLYDTDAWHKVTLAVGPAAPWDERRAELPEPERVGVQHGGVTVHARRYSAGEGRMLCWVHGGPTDQWQVDWRPRITYWWSRGWDVLVVDPRGTTGHGRTYQRALNGGWGRIDVDDSATMIAAAHERGWATPESTVMIGGSSGGLTVLGVLADHGDLVAGGVASYPVSDLRALAEATHRFEAHYTDTLVGPHEDHDAFVRLSPIHRAGSITKPLLLFHGDEDPVVPKSQSDELVERIQSSDGDVEYVVYEGEGHGFRDPDIVRDEYERTERFLDRLAGDR
jgi:dipeptidyl aminopeptidase/acylaminoacyl peptidase